MKIQCINVGVFNSNCYVVSNQQREAYVIDPGADADEIAGFLQENNLTPKAILLTHAHFDHIGAVPQLVSEFRLPVVLDARDETIFHSSENHMLPLCPPVRKLPQTVRELAPVPIADLPFTVLETPGHTPGGRGYYFEPEGLVFSGDTLFQQGVGRTDLPGGDWDTLLRSLRDVLFALPEDTRVYPGHGPPTVIGREKLTNPYARMSAL